MSKIEIVLGVSGTNLPSASGTGKVPAPSKEKKCGCLAVRTALPQPGLLVCNLNSTGTPS